MGNRRLTLAVPPFSISRDELEFSGNCSNHVKLRLADQQPSPGSKSSAKLMGKINHECEELELTDWLNSDKFPPLTPRQGIPSVSFGLPKHSQPTGSARHDRLHNQRPQPVAAFGDSSILIGDLPIEFVWSSKGQEIEILQDEKVATALSSEKSRSQKGKNVNAPGMENGEKLGSWAMQTQKERAPGPAHTGTSIADLFQHSYIPPTRAKTKRPAPPTNHWLWVLAARVWDPAAERFPASREDIRRFGASAKLLRRVQQQTLDGRSFVEVVKQDMDQKQFHHDNQDGHDNRASFRVQIMREEIIEVVFRVELMMGVTIELDSLGRIEMGADIRGMIVMLVKEEGGLMEQMTKATMVTEAIMAGIRGSSRARSELMINLRQERSDKGHRKICVTSLKNAGGVVLNSTTINKQETPGSRLMHRCVATIVTKMGITGLYARTSLSVTVAGILGINRPNVRWLSLRGLHCVQWVCLGSFSTHSTFQKLNLKTNKRVKP